MQSQNEKSKINIMAILTIIYLLMIIIFAVGDLEQMKALKPNEWGDFFAGFFAPLAFLWLVFGYYQQGQELKQNTEALRLQAEELRNSVQEQKRQNKIYEDQIIEKRVESKPIFDVKDAGYSYRIYDQSDEYFEGTIFSFKIVNYGKIAKEVEIIGKWVKKRFPTLESNQITPVRFTSADMEKELCDLEGKPLSIELDLLYSDNSGYQYHQKIELVTDSFVHSAVGVDFEMQVNLSN